MSHQLLQYDYVEKLSKPIDLTGSKFEAHIYKPIEYEIKLKHEESGREIIRVLTFDIETEDKIRSLKTDEEKSSFINSLDIVQKTLKEMISENEKSG